jgi:mannosyltransferase OCH1-like enzyme
MCYKTKDIPTYIINNWKLLNPDYEIIIYDDNDCIDFFKKNYGNEYVDIYNYIKDGPIKADFWRICILYIYGGVYSDIDIEPLVSISDFYKKDVSFLTCLSAVSYLNPHFIMSVPNNIIFKKCIDIYLTKFRNKEKYSYWDWSIVTIMEHVFITHFQKKFKKSGVYNIDGIKYQFLQEVIKNKLSTIKIFGIKLGNDHNHYCEYNGRKILNNRYKDYDNHKFK